MYQEKTNIYASHVIDQAVGVAGASLPLEGGDPQHDGGHGVRAPGGAAVRLGADAAGRAGGARRHVPDAAPGGHGGAAQRLLQRPRRALPVPDHGQRHRPHERRAAQLHAEGPHRGGALPQGQRWRRRPSRADKAAVRLDALLLCRAASRAQELAAMLCSLIYLPLASSTNWYW